MVQSININGEEYPFFFSFRAVFAFMNGQNLNDLESMDNEVYMQFDSMLKLYEQASKKGAKKVGKPEKELSVEQIEDHIDEDPMLFMRLQEEFEESKVVQAMNEDPEAEKKAVEEGEPEKFTQDKIYQLGLGVLGYNSDELLDLTIKQFFNAVKGKYDYDGQLLESRQQILFSGLRFNASSISAGLSKELSHKISDIKFDWERVQKQLKKSSQPISFDDFAPQLDIISE